MLVRFDLRGDLGYLFDMIACYFLVKVAVVKGIHKVKEPNKANFHSSNRQNCQNIYFKELSL